VASHIENILAAGTDEVPYFAVGFRNGTVRAFYPSDRDPLEYRQQVTANEGGIRLLSSEEVDPAALEFIDPQMGVTL
jgi:hypothetical protein